MYCFHVIFDEILRQAQHAPKWVWQAVSAGLCVGYSSKTRPLLDDRASIMRAVYNG